MDLRRWKFRADVIVDWVPAENDCITYTNSVHIHLMKGAIVCPNDLEHTGSDPPHSYSTTPTFGPSVRYFFEGDGLEMSIAAIRIDLKARVKTGGSSTICSRLT